MFKCSHCDKEFDSLKKLGGHKPIHNEGGLCPNCHTQTETWCSRNIKNSNRSMYARTRYKKIMGDAQTEIAGSLHGS